MSNISMKHDGCFDIATGKSRLEKNWKNTQVYWSALVERLSQTHRTAETHAEYMNAKKPRQDEIKDIGGFVGGYLAGGKRSRTSVLHRQLLTLDVDFGKHDVWGDYCLLYGNAAAVYSTHKHTPEAPRLRLILPLDREVAMDEYMAIGRRLAGQLGIDCFDPTTYQPSRLMYWPSTSKDGVYVFEYQDGPWLSADEILGTYHDWRDSSEWPVSERERRGVERDKKEHGNPLEKNNIVGRFCRVYNIHQAIEKFLNGVYEPSDIDGRYTYKEGSTAAGLITYDDVFAYSHHGTDPASSKLCNAFDLVRIHKFGHKDDNVKEDTPGHKLPSYLAMDEFANADPEIKKLSLAENQQRIKADFDIVEEDEVENDDWKKDLETDKKGRCVNSINNVVLILHNDAALKNSFGFNEFEQREVLFKDLPWRKYSHEKRYLIDTDEKNLRHYLEACYGITARNCISDGLEITIRKKSFHPIREFFKQLEWDGVNRVDTLLIDYLGADDSEYVRTVTRKTLVAAVARILTPGCKFDNMLTLAGPQGIGKSTIIDKLGAPWFSNSFSFTMVNNKEANEQLQGAWIIEVGELNGLKTADLAAVKNFLQKKEDRFRVTYEKRLEFFPRQCIFIGSTNKPAFLRDVSGNRRFWPIDLFDKAPGIKNVFRDFTGYEIRQVWAEAINMYRKGEDLFLTPEMEEMALAVQQEHSEQDERAGLIEKYLDTLLPENWANFGIGERQHFIKTGESTDLGATVEGVLKRKTVCAAEIWCELFGEFQSKMTTHNTKFIHDIMRQIKGWVQEKNRKIFSLYGKQYVYRRVDITKSTCPKTEQQRTTLDSKK